MVVMDTSTSLKRCVSSIIDATGCFMWQCVFTLKCNSICVWMIMCAKTGF